MKLTALILLAAGTMHLCAAGTNDAPVTNLVAETHITSRSVDFDLKSRTAIYRGNVRVEDPRINLTCELLTATIAESGGRVDSLMAESNVVATIATNDRIFTVKSPKAIYTYQLLDTATNQVLELAGVPDPTITWPQADSDPPKTNEFAARRIIWNIGTGMINAEGHRGVFPDLGASRKVAIPALGTNRPANPMP